MNCNDEKKLAEIGEYPFIGDDFPAVGSNERRIESAMEGCNLELFIQFLLKNKEKDNVRCVKDGISFLKYFILTYKIEIKSLNVSLEYILSKEVLELLNTFLLEQKIFISEFSILGIDAFKNLKELNINNNLNNVTALTITNCNCTLNMDVFFRLERLACYDSSVQIIGITNALKVKGLYIDNSTINPVYPNLEILCINNIKNVFDVIKYINVQSCLRHLDIRNCSLPSNIALSIKNNIETLSVVSICNDDKETKQFIYNTQSSNNIIEFVIDPDTFEKLTKELPENPQQKELY